MTSTNTVPGLVVDNLFLAGTTFSNLIGADSSTTANISFVFPPDTGSTGAYLQNTGSGISEWVASSNLAPTIAVVNDDFYRTRTNQGLSGNIITGVADNSGGIDTLGGSLVLHGNPIQSVYLVTPPKKGIVTFTGSTGSFLYRSNPRYLGLDSFSYYLVDNLGLTSLNRATCTISVESNGPLGNNTGPYFIYCTTSSTNVIQYNNGTESVLFTALYPSGPTGDPGIGMLATNRDDNLIYYTSTNAPTANQGYIYAYDYVNDYQFLLADAATDSRFVNPSLINFNRTTASYYNSVLYISQNGFSGGTGIYKVAVGPYSYTGWTSGTGSQSILGVSYSTLKSSLFEQAFAWDYFSKKLYTIGNTAVTAGTAGRITLVNTSLGFEIKSTTASYMLSRKAAMGPDSILYSVVPGSTAVTDIYMAELTLGRTFDPISDPNVSSMAEYISLPT